ncbi:Indoleamine 2,3-dioxygenase [Radiomyces spectabilis]|uniref:Indoleamine 2,3-dioxygenase n=1 Tax=Radiomyces spectabilis TaxID=64574 RepID=UPI00221FF381|nr:Indoleamine 2,3-dioxygenase [Radiomyces spectabilis]KAI8373087.1 Indoleamine 2,3-dioxygenase [Radiomyces spectabilis]
MRSLEDYDISPITGFLPVEPPLRRLPDPYFAPWEEMMENFNGLLLAGKFREKVLQMPLLDHTRLTTTAEYRRAFVIFCFLSHSYVWGKLEKTSETLPATLAVPWTGISNYLGLCPVVCHAAVDLWNYRLLDADGPIDLSNLAALTTYSGSLDEAWFYLITTAIESAGACCLPAILSVIEHINDCNYDGIKSNLETMYGALVKMNEILQRMYEKCDPYVFYWKIRPYLAGWENMAEAGLPFGLVYEGVDHLWSAETDEYADMSHLTEGQRILRQYRRYAGGSAAQSSLIAALDVAFGVEHYPTGEKPSVMKLDNPLPKDRYTRLPSAVPTDDSSSDGSRTPQPPFTRTNRNAFLRAMRKYMPRPHREFLEDLESGSNIRPFMLHLREKMQAEDITAEELNVIELYNNCIHQLKLFRDKHVQIVSLYIVNQARKGPNIPHGGFAIDKKKEEQPAAEAKDEKTQNVLYPQTALETSPGIREGSVSAKVSHLFPELGLAKHVDPKTGVVRGTGGTNVMPFLKQSRDETADMKIALESPATAPSNKTWSDWIMRR